MSNSTSRPYIERLELQTLNEFDISIRRTSQNTTFIIYSDDRIELVGQGSIDATPIYSALSQSSLAGFRKTIVRLTQDNRLSPQSAYAQIYYLAQFLKKHPFAEFDLDSINELQNFTRSLHDTAFHSLKSLLIFWHKCGYDGVSADAADLLRLLRDHKNTRLRGSRIRSDDPNEGWYTDQEYDDLVAAIWSDMESNAVPLEQTALSLLSAQYGRRPFQLTQLKIGDLIDIGKTHGVTGPRIHFPGAKDKNSGGFRKAQIEVHPVSPELWDICQSVALDTVKSLEKFHVRKFTPDEIRQLPLFAENTHSQSALTV